MLKEMKERGWGRSVWMELEGERSEKGIMKKKGKRGEGDVGGETCFGRAYGREGAGKE